MPKGERIPCQPATSVLSPISERIYQENILSRLITCIDVGDRWLRWPDNHLAMVCFFTDFDADNCHNGYENDKSHNTADRNPGNNPGCIVSVKRGNRM